MKFTIRNKKINANTEQQYNKKLAGVCPFHVR